LIPSFDGRYYENTKLNPKFLIVLTTGAQARSIADSEPAVPSGSRVRALVSPSPFLDGPWGERRENPLFESRHCVAEFRSHDPSHTDHAVSGGVDPVARGTFGQPSTGGCGRRVLNDVCVGAVSDPDLSLHLSAAPRGADSTTRASLLWGVTCNGVRNGVDPGGMPL